MKKHLLTICLLTLLSFTSRLYAQRYLTEIFTNTTVTSGIVYGHNYTTLYSPVSLTVDSLRADVYQPVGDVLTTRPTVILLHAGSMIPVFYNYECTGIKTDSAVAEMCRQFARRGYTAIAIEYRYGWNPISTDQDTRTGSLLQAVGRAIQDAKACVRFFRNNALTTNTYNIDPNMFILGGLNTGGYIALGYATLNSYSEIQLLKFLSSTTNPVYHFNPGATFFDSTYWGDYDGYGGTPSLNYSGNNPGVSNAIQFAFSLGGALGDSSWLQAGDVPMVCFHSKSDPGAPYGDGAVYVGSTGAFVLNASGSYTVIRKADSLQNNWQFQNNSFTDPFTTRANQVNDGYDGLFPFTPSFPQSAPWEWWDSTTVYNTMMFGLGFTQGHSDTVWYNAKADNPDMSRTKALAYIDTIMGYLNPRIFTVVAGTQEISQLENSVSVYPNPAADHFTIQESDYSKPIRTISLYDLTGRLIRSIDRINASSFVMNTKSLDAGMYLVKIRFDKGTVVRKITLE